MHSKKLFLLASLALFALCAIARSQPLRAFEFILQVAAFPDREATQIFAAGLVNAGQRPVWGTVSIPGRGVWFRVYIGEFATAEQARAAGDGLVARGIIKEYLVKRAEEISLLGRSRRLDAVKKFSPRYESRTIKSSTGLARRADSLIANPAGNKEGLALHEPGFSMPVAIETDTKAMILPVGSRVIASLAPSSDVSFIPRPDPVHLAFKIIAGELDSALNPDHGRTGLWLSGDIEDALARLRWIVGSENAKLLTLDYDGRLRVDPAWLQEFLAAASVDPAAETIVLADFISSNEGLLLVVQMAEGPHRYLLHIGPRAPTRGSDIAVGGSVNLDTNFDGRINPYRKGRTKLNQELPPEGFDAMIAINPVARWLNLRANRLVPVGHITFHELAEAHAKVALGLEYLGQGIRPGAHSVALDRERILKLQRPGFDIVLTAGSNRVLRSNQEVRQLFAETGGQR